MIKLTLLALKMDVIRLKQTEFSSLYDSFYPKLHLANVGQVSILGSHRTLTCFLYAPNEINLSIA